MREGGPEMGQKLEQELGLSEEQKSKLKSLRRARRDKMQASQNALQDAREDLRELMAKPDRSQSHTAKLRAKHEEIAKLDAEAAKQRFEGLLEMREVLTDAQLMAAAKADFQKRVAAAGGYISPVPPEVKPPLTMSTGG